MVGTVVSNTSEATPSEIAPGESVPIRLLICTGLGGGEKISHLQVQAQTPDGYDVAPAELAVFTYIMVPLAAQPQSSSFVVHEEDLSAPVKQTVVLADLWPGDGLPIKSITSTLGDKLHYQLTPSRGEIGIDSRMLHKRYNLELSFILDPTKPDFDHTVTITPDHPKAKPAEIRLFGKIIPRCSLDTNSLAFCGAKPGQRITRRIEYRYHNPKDREIRVVKAPDCLKASVSESGDGLKVVTLTCILPEGNSAQADEVRFEFGRDKKCSVLPVFISCQTDDPKRPG